MIQSIKCFRLTINSELIGMLPDYPALKQKLNEKFEDIIKNKVQEEPFLSQIQRKIIQEGNTFSITSSDGYSSKTDYEEFASHYEISFDEIIKNGPEAFYSKAAEVSKELANNMVKHSIGVLEEVTERTGNVVKREKGKPITPTVILDAIEKMEIGFDEKGNPIMPTLLISSEDFEKIKNNLREWEANGELEERRKEIIEKKRKEWLDRESNRKLVD